MEYINRNIELDFNAAQAVQQTTIKLNTDNRGSVRFNIRALDGEKEFDYTSFPTVGIVIHKPDGNNVAEDSNSTNRLTVSSTGIAYILHEEALTAAGNIVMQVDLYTQGTTETIEDGAKKFSTLFFSFQVVASALRTRALSIASGTFLGQLEKLIAAGGDQYKAFEAYLEDLKIRGLLNIEEFEKYSAGLKAQGQSKYDTLAAYLEELKTQGLLSSEEYEKFLTNLKTQGRTEYEAFEEYLAGLKEQGLLTVEEIKLILADVQAGAFVTIADFETVTDYLESTTSFGLSNNTSVRYGNGAMGNVLNSVPNNSVAIGYTALPNATSPDNIAIGSYSLQNNTTGAGNIAIGTNALQANTAGLRSVAIGFRAFMSATNTSAESVAIGAYAMQNATGSYSIGIGSQALRNATGGWNLAIGAGALQANVGGGNNIGIGYQAMYSNLTGGNNTAIGAYALYSAMSARFNTAIGTFAGYALSAGNDNVLLGYQAGYYLSDGTTQQTEAVSSVFLGSNSKGCSINSVNQIVIGYNAIGYGSNTAHIGNTSLATISYGPATGTAFTNRSDPRIKEDIQDANLEICVENVKSLPLHYFKYKDFIGNEGDQHVLGFLSPEFGEILPKAVHKNTMSFDERDESGNIVYETRLVNDYVDEEIEVTDPETGETRIEVQPVLTQIEKEAPKQIVIEDCESIDSSQLVPILWGAVQQLIARVEELEAKINE